MTWCKEIFAARPNPLAPFHESRLYEYQEQVLSLLREPFQKRRIIWIWSEESGTGKTSTLDLVAKTFDPVFYAPLTTLNDATLMYSNESVVIFDCARGFNVRDAGFCSYLERVSDYSRTSSGKYAGKTVVWQCHVLVTSNAPPPSDLLPQRFIEVPAVKSYAADTGSISIQFE